MSSARSEKKDTKRPPDEEEAIAHSTNRQKLEKEEVKQPDNDAAKEDENAKEAKRPPDEEDEEEAIAHSTKRQKRSKPSRRRMRNRKR